MQLNFIAYLLWGTNKRPSDESSWKSAARVSTYIILLHTKGETSHKNHSSRIRNQRFILKTVLRAHAYTFVCARVFIYCFSFILLLHGIEHYSHRYAVCIMGCVHVRTRVRRVSIERRKGRGTSGEETRSNLLHSRASQSYIFYEIKEPTSERAKTKAGRRGGRKNAILANLRIFLSAPPSRRTQHKPKWLYLQTAVIYHRIRRRRRRLR